MNNRLITVLLFLLTSVILYGQTIQDNIYYSRYEGVVDSNFQVIANVVRLKDNISGNYNYHYSSDKKKDNYSNSIALTGEVSNNDYRFKEYGKNDMLFSGSIEKDNFEGQWYYKNSFDIPFKISESYPNGSMPFDVHYLHSEDKLIVDMEDSPTAEIELTLLFPIVVDSNNKVVNSICRNIALGFFGSNFYDRNPDSMLTKFEDEYYQNYINQNSARYDSGASANWQKIVSMSVINNSNYIICLEYLKYAYSGGAHGMTNISYYNIDLVNGEQISYDDIFINDTTGLLSDLLTEKLYAQKQIPTDMGLVDAGYFVDKIEPNHNIFLNNTGIGFMYNSYEIAPYSYGQTSVFLEYDKIKHLIRTNSPIYEFIK